MPPVAGALKTRGEAELKDLPLTAGGLKVLLRATCGATKLFLGWITGSFNVPGFERIAPCGLLIELDGATLAILGAVATFAEASRFWLSPTIVRALVWTLAELNACGEVTRLATVLPRRLLVTGSTINVL
jgi:hypothetical protein